MKVYLVTSGNYSEYRVEAIYSTQEAAEKHVALLNAPETCSVEDPTVEEVEVDAFAAGVARGLLLWCVLMHRDGDGFAELTDELERLGRHNFTPHQDPSMEYVCWARDEQHAIKIANEHRAQLIALGQWPEDR